MSKSASPEKAVTSVSLGQLRNRSLVDQIVGLIGTEIASGRLPPGHRVPNETEWCAQLGVSRTVLREAISVLTSKGLLDTKPRTGGRVRERKHWHRLDPLVLQWEAAAGPSEVFVTEAFELRRLIEPAACELAAERAQPGQIEELESTYHEMVKNIEDAHQFFFHDSSFHQIIFEASGNTLVRALGAVIGSTLDISLGLSLDAPRGQAHCLPLHLAVLEAIQSKKPDAARAAMLRLIEDAEKDVRQALSSKNRKASEIEQVRKSRAKIAEPEPFRD